MGSAYENVQNARKKGRPTSKKYIDAIFNGFIELHGDRRFSDDAAIIGGLAYLKDLPVTVIGIEKGGDVKESVRRNFGAPNPEGYRKALRLMKQAEKFHRPVICFVDTSGAFCGIGAEERGQGQAISENLMEMMTLKTPIISVFIGEGGSGGALALAVADRVWMMENAIYSVISPEGCASILWKDTKRVIEAAECLKLTAADMESLGVIEYIFTEADMSWEDIYASIKEKLWITLNEELISLTPEELTQKRYDRFRRIGSQPMYGFIN